MNDNNQKIWSAITSAIDGNISDEEKKILDVWINESEENKRFFESMILQGESDYDSSDEVKERIFNKIKAVLPNHKTLRFNFWIPAAAASVAIIVTTIAFSLFTKPWEKAEMVFLEAKTPYGVKTKMVLPDSSVVFLNSGSYLRYPAIFNNNTRDVYLKGEAYFEVHKDSTCPFIVNTPAISIKVLGTHFNVKAFPDENLYETTLLEGSVALFRNSDPKKEVYRIKPNQKVSFFENSGRTNVQKIDAELEVSWKDGKFYFDNETLTSIAKDLERNFNVPIKICSQELKNEIFSGFFDKNRTVYQTLDIMKLHKNFYYLTQNDTIMVYLKK
jgi:ferric-dicitrate binding protein FerR (iron transport regulator)